MAFQTFTPLQYLMIDVATNFGLDRENWDTRLDWFADNTPALREILEISVTNHRELRKHPLMKTADSPALFFTALKAWEKAERGEPVAHPVSLDATASGAQIMAIVTGCEASAKLCNVVDTVSRKDLYTEITASLQTRVANPGSVTRGRAKGAIMPWFYGSEAEPIAVFGEGEELAAFQETMETDAPGITMLRAALIDLWDPAALSHDWTLPDNFHVKVKVEDKVVTPVIFAGKQIEVVRKVNGPVPRGVKNAANVIHSLDGMVVREMSRRCSYDPAKAEALLKLLDRPTSDRPNTRSPNHDLVEQLWNHYTISGFLSARILELIDEDNIHLVDKAVIAGMVLTLPDQPFPMISVHDCFRCHPNYCNDMRRQYNQILYELACSDVMSFIASQIAGYRIISSKLGDIAPVIRDSNYALS